MRRSTLRYLIVALALGLGLSTATSIRAQDGPPSDAEKAEVGPLVKLMREGNKLVSEDKNYTGAIKSFKDLSRSSRRPRSAPSGRRSSSPPRATTTCAASRRRARRPKRSRPWPA